MLRREEKNTSGVLNRSTELSPGQTDVEGHVSVRLLIRNRVEVMYFGSLRGKVREGIDLEGL